MMLDSLLQGFLFVKVKGDDDNFSIAAQSVWIYQSIAGLWCVFIYYSGDPSQNTQKSTSTMDISDADLLALARLTTGLITAFANAWPSPRSPPDLQQGQA